jgi:pyruvate dehydrogenase E2 component (dihydrolipoamide acetyltransferase)
MKIFKLPDLGEGLPDAEIVEWHVAEGDEVTLDGPLVSMETAKAVVDVPSPYTGKVAKLFGQAGDVIETGNPLAGFYVEGESGEEMAEEAPEITVPHPDPEETEEVQEDSGTVVGQMESSDAVVSDGLSSVAGVKVTPAVRALARKLKVDLATVAPTGKDGVVTRGDVENAAKQPQTARPAPAAAPEPTPVKAPPAAPPSGEWEPIRGTRRTMARIMSEAHRSIVPTSLMDDADIHNWAYGQDIMVRLIRSMWAGAQAEPGLNAWYDGEQSMRILHKGMDVIPPEDMKGYTIMLSNFGIFAGRYATPIINPPCVCIVAAGKLRHEVVPVLGGFEVHRTIPLSLTFDHRACTGGEAARFLMAMIADLALPE